MTLPHRIDSHHHFWNYSASEYGWISDSMSVLKRDFGPEDLYLASHASGITGVVSVQAQQSLAETDNLIRIGRESALVRGVVGWVPLAIPNCRDVLDTYATEPLLKGVRHVVQDEPDDAFILGEAFNAGIDLLADFGLVYDILIYAKHLPNTIEFVDRHPDQSFVLDHIAKPTIIGSRFDAEWARGITALAKRPNVRCKFSGVVTEVRDEAWTVETVRPYWDVALEAFGPKRFMYGSDWPVCLLRSSYEQWISTVETLASPLSHSEQAAFWHETAMITYRL